MKNDFKYRHEIVVRWSDMDAIGHVNNATYFTYCEEARIGYFRALQMQNFTQPEEQGPALVSATCNFRNQVRHPSLLDVGVRTTKIGSRSLTLEFEIYQKREDALVTDGSCVIAWVDYKLGKAIRVPEALRESVMAFEGRDL